MFLGSTEDRCISLVGRESVMDRMCRVVWLKLKVLE